MARSAPTAAARTFLAAAFFALLPVEASPQGRFEPAFTGYGIADGMFNPIVEALLQDDLGFLWIGTHDGLLRFDGVGFKTYRSRTEDPSSLEDDFITALASADSGRIWIGAQEGGLQLFDPLTEEVRHIPLSDLGPWRQDDSEGLAQDRRGRFVGSILRSRQGPLLLITDIGLVRFDPASGEAENLMPAWDGPNPLPHATALSATPDGSALIAVSDGSVALWTGNGRPTPLRLSLPDSVASLQRVGDGYLATTYDGVVHVVDPDIAAAQAVLSVPWGAGDRHQVRKTLPLPDGTLWIATQSGAFSGDPATGAIRRVGVGEGNRSLPNQDVRDLVLDQTGVIWFGTWNGLASLHPESGGMARLYTGPDVEGSGVVAMVGEAEGGLWVGALDGGVQLLRRRGSAIAGPATRPAGFAELGRPHVYRLARDRAGRLWVAAFSSGVWVQEGQAPARRIPFVDGNGEEQEGAANYVFVDHAGDVWASVRPLGLLRFDARSGVFRIHRGADPASWHLGSDYLWPIAEDALSRLWVGSFRGGLVMVSADRGSSTLYRAGPGMLGDNRILTVFVDSRGQVWVGTEGGGVTRFDPTSGVFRTWTEEDGLPHDNVESVIEDRDGQIWMGTTDGLARFNPSTEEYLVYREPAGLAGNRFYANSAHRDADGLLYFGGPSGITIVDPAALAAKETAPRVSLTGFRIQGRDASLARAVRTDLLDLGPKENFFAFEFAAMDFADVSQNRYRYRLDPLDAGWVEAGNTPVANYTSVPPGRYVFRVAARNSEGVWNEAALALPIRVQAPFYRTLWFQSLVLVAVLSLAAGFYTYRLRQVEARQRLRLEIAGKLHDDIGANLSNIALKADMVRTTASLDDRRAQLLGDVGRLARETAHKVRETVWVVNTKYDTAGKLLSHMHDTADTLLSGHVPYRFDAPEAPPERPVSMEFRQNVHLLFKEVVNNVVKHAGASQVDITLTCDANSLGFRVVDDGVGFDPATADKSNGQQLMRGRAESVRGHLEVTSAPGQGTTVAFAARLR